MERVREERMKRARDLAEEERRAKRQRDRELAAALEVEEGGFSAALFVTRNEHVWPAERRRDRADAERCRLRDMVRGVSIGVTSSSGSSRARMLVRRARSMFARTDTRHLVDRLAALCRRARF